MRSNLHEKWTERFLIFMSYGMMGNGINDTYDWTILSLLVVAVVVQWHVR